jgi:UDP-N-acetylmuramyl pentapeptide phosphotransferase/UDP-N-acetylglucosamine-1-phosphate transferase
MNNTLNILIQIVLPTIMAFIAVNWSYFKILKIAKEKKIVDAPDSRKLQRTPIPVLGGIAVFFGMVMGLLIGLALQYWFPTFLVVRLAPILCSAMLMIYIGAMDDIIGLSPLSRFAIEILTLFGIIFASGICVDNLNGMWGVGSISWWIAVPLTIFGGVGIINAVNMIDGVNGLSSGLCITCSILFGLGFLLVGDIVNAMLAFIVSAALVPFLFHNVFGNHSRMFIGDAGTMMMGVLLFWFVIVMLNGDVVVWERFFGGDVNLIALALAILSVPIFDTVRVMFFRILHGENPFHPDKTHLHHVFVRMGVSHSITAITEILLDLIIVGIWVAFVCIGVSIDMQLYLIIAISLILVWGVYFLFHWHEEHHTEFMHRLTRFGIKTQLGHKMWWQRIERWLDGPMAKKEKKVENALKYAISVEDYYNFDKIDPNNFKEQDRKRIYDFIKGKAEVYVDDVKQRSGANPLRVDAIIDEGLLDGFIIIIKEGVWGTPMIISMIEKTVNIDNGF